MMIRLFECATDPERQRLHRLLASDRRERSPEDVAWVRARMDAYDCIDYARQVAHGLAGAANHEFSQTFGGLPPSRDKSFIEALPTWVLERA